MEHEAGKIISFLASKPMVVLYYTPLVAIVVSWMSELPRKQKLSKLYDANGTLINYWKKASSPFLPVEEFTSKAEYDGIHDYLVQQQQQAKELKKDDGTRPAAGNTASWALVTGASQGIGRAIAISLARRNIPVVLVARDVKKLEQLSRLIKECYGVQTLVIPCDLNSNGAAEKISDALAKATCDIDILVNNAGIGETCDLVDMTPDRIDQLCQVNIVSTTKLTQLLGSKMKARQRGRIVIISSLTGAVPGVPTTAVYAATKSYQRSLATSLGREMESYGVGVSCIMPGAVKETSFAAIANMSDSVVWKLPFGGLTPEIVAESAVRAMLFGHREVVVGWINIVMVRVVSILLPRRLTVLVCENTWRPLPSFFTKKNQYTRM